MKTALLTMAFAAFALAGCSDKKDSTPSETSTTATTTTPQEIPGPGKVENMDPVDLNMWYDKEGEFNFTVLDVRTPEEYSGGSLPGSKNIDFLAGDFQSKVSGLDKEATWVVICAAGKRSSSAAQQMADMGFKHVWALNGGLDAWTRDGYDLAH